MAKELTFGYSPCPNDTFMFNAIANGKVGVDGHHLKPVLHDVETLNGMAMDSVLDVTKLSFYAWMVVKDRYHLLNSGAATEPVVEYTPQIIPVGLVLDVTPQVGQDEVITLNVHPTLTHITDVVESPNEDTQPVVAVRELDTVGKVRHGETLVIAGLLSEATLADLADQLDDVEQVLADLHLVPNRWRRLEAV